jgi:TNF receptor-associated factor 2/TNF receptor-associated factor 3/TNF receptor-associated factor 4
MQRMELNDHKLHHCSHRIVQCPHCRIELEERATEPHFAVCEKLPLPCELDCGEQVNRENMENHVSEVGDCPNTILSCPFEAAGCDFACKRCEVDKHLAMDVLQHQLKQQQMIMTQQQTTRVQLQAMAEQLSQLQDENKELKRKQATTDDSISWLRSVMWQVFKQSCQDMSMVSTCGQALVRVNIMSGNWHESGSFLAHPLGYMATINIIYQSGDRSMKRPPRDLYIGLCLARGKQDDRLDWPFKKRHTITLIDQQAKGKQSISKTIDPSALDDSLNDYCFSRAGHYEDESSRADDVDLYQLRTQHAMLYVSHSALRTHNYVKNDTILIEVRVDN